MICKLRCRIDRAVWLWAGDIERKTNLGFLKDHYFEMSALLNIQIGARLDLLL
jgi:hypothetical protein